MIEYDAHKWTPHLFDIKGSMVREITGRVLLVVAWAIIVVVFHEYVRPVHVPSTVHALVGVALGLLLVIRTNASYDRFWEGRRMWGGIVNESRNLSRAAGAFLREQPALLESINKWTIAFSYASMHALRGTNGLGPMAERLPQSEVEETLRAQHVPSAVALRISNLLADARRAGHISDYVAMTLDNNVQLLIDYLGACERIHKTPLPFAYVVHLRRALILYCLTLPFALIETYGWTTIVDTLLIAYIFFGIEEIGVEIEDPFGEDDNDLPLEQICATIENNLLAALEEGGATSLKARSAEA
ncbi:MAG TPA: bestrophin family ion channel [Pyrinomonadaceae bacterium]|nr:bestrophin family ion channel [Pyrinomonadaceae bacterium]